MSSMRCAGVSVPMHLLATRDEAWHSAAGPSRRQASTNLRKSTHRIHHVELDTQVGDVVADPLGGGDDARPGAKDENLC